MSGEILIFPIEMLMFVLWLVLLCPYMRCTRILLIFHYTFVVLSARCILFAIRTIHNIVNVIYECVYNDKVFYSSFPSFIMKDILRDSAYTIHTFSSSLSK